MTTMHDDVPHPVPPIAYLRCKLYKYWAQPYFTSDFSYAGEIGDDKLRVKFVEPHGRIELKMNNDDLALDVAFRGHESKFDSEDCDAANPDRPSVREILYFGTRRPYRR